LTHRFHSNPTDTRSHAPLFDAVALLAVDAGVTGGTPEGNGWLSVVTFSWASLDSIWTTNEKNQKRSTGE